jgi:hypothetical protein
MVIIVMYVLSTFKQVSCIIVNTCVPGNSSHYVANKIFDLCCQRFGMHYVVFHLLLFSMLL